MTSDGQCPIIVHDQRRVLREARLARQACATYEPAQARGQQLVVETPAKVEHLGLFKTPEAAHLAWKARKLELALELKPKMDEIDLRIYPRIVEIINNAK